VKTAGRSTQSVQGIGAIPVLPQAAALCYRIEKGRLRVLLITTRGAGRWIIPKGWLIDGISPAQTAAQEAWEEAGVLGQCAGRIGQFTHIKNGADQRPAPCLVDVFPLRVQSISRHFPEKGMRRRKWFSPKKAALKVRSPELAALLRSFRPYWH